jgi:L-lactate dehydrogenase complex protein LldG
MSAKTDILKSIRGALGVSGGADRGPELPVERDYRVSLGLEPEARIELFVDRLVDYNATVYRCESENIAATVAEALGVRGKSGLVVPSGLPKEWLPAGFDFTVDDGLDYDALDASQGALTASTAAIAFTGSIILTHSPAEGRRALSLIPDYHLCVVFESTVRETVPEALRSLKDRRTSPITTIAGPSATADIEMMRVKGVHGPRTLDVVIVA